MTNTSVSITYAVAIQLALIAIFISFCVHSSNNSLWNSTVACNEYFESAVVQIASAAPRISVLDFFGSVLACKTYRERAHFPKTWLESLVACTILQFGGTTLTGIVLGQTPSWITSFSAFPALLLAWILIFFCPGDLFWRVFNALSVITLPLFEIGSAISAGHAVTSWGMDKALFNMYHLNAHKYKDSILLCLLCGTFSGCGGGLLGDWLGFLRQPSFIITSTPAIYSIRNRKAATTVVRCFCMATLYYFLLNPSGHFPYDPIVSKEGGHAVIGILLVVNAVVAIVYKNADLYGNFTELLMFTIHPSSSSYSSPKVDDVVVGKKGISLDGTNTAVTATTNNNKGLNKKKKKQS